jgi:DNA-binding CsgD family transcriptional regulator
MTAGREAEIARLVALGRTNKEVSSELGLSPKTVEWHLSRLYRRLGVRSRTELSVLLLRSAAGDHAPLRLRRSSSAQARIKARPRGSNDPHAATRTEGGAENGSG